MDSQDDYNGHEEGWHEDDYCSHYDYERPCDTCESEDCEGCLWDEGEY